MEQMEKRIIDSPVEIRKEGDKQYIEGAAIMFGVESQDLGGFREIIDPRALDKADMSDVIIRCEHSNDYVLGRTSSGTATVTIGKKSANYRVEAPNTTTGRDTVEMIQRGDLRASSFAFSGVTDTWEKRDDMAIRTITGIKKIHDMSPVYSPAYLQTDNLLALRSLEEWRAKEEKKVEIPKEIEEKPVDEPFVSPGLSLSDKVRLLKLKGKS